MCVTEKSPLIAALATQLILTECLLIEVQKLQLASELLGPVMAALEPKLTIVTLRWYYTVKCTFTMLNLSLSHAYIPANELSALLALLGGLLNQAYPLPGY